MSKTDQRNHFEIVENRYKEELLKHPPQHVQDEIKLIVKEILKRKVAKVIDFGSGNGRLTIPLLQKGLDVVAVDISNKSLAALQLFAAKNISQISILSVSNYIPKGKWHAIVGCDILHHVPLEKTLSEMRRKLKDEKGVIIFSEPNIINISWLIYVTLFLNWKIEGGMIQCHYFNFISILKRNNFKNITLHGYGIIPPIFLNSFPILQKINYFFGNLPLIKLFAYRYIIVAQAD